MNSVEFSREVSSANTLESNDYIGLFTLKTGLK